VHSIAIARACICILHRKKTWLTCFWVSLHMQSHHWQYRTREEWTDSQSSRERSSRACQRLMCEGHHKVRMWQGCCGDWQRAHAAVQTHAWSQHPEKMLMLHHLQTQLRVLVSKCQWGNCVSARHILSLSCSLPLSCLSACASPHTHSCKHTRTHWHTTRYWFSRPHSHRLTCTCACTLC
jgi:hypothetical protein